MTKTVFHSFENDKIEILVYQYSLPEKILNNAIKEGFKDEQTHCKILSISCLLLVKLQKHSTNTTE